MPKPMTHEVRNKIREYAKNRMDISDLIAGYSIKGEDLSGTIIQYMTKPDEDMSECNFANCIIGLKENIINWNRAKLRNCCFVRTVFQGVVWARHSDASGSNFREAYLPYMDYKFADLRGCTFCNTVFSLGSQDSYGAVFSKDFLRDVADNSHLVVLYEHEYKELLKCKEQLNEYRST